MLTSHALRVTVDWRAEVTPNEGAALSPIRGSSDYMESLLIHVVSLLMFGTFVALALMVAAGSRGV